MKTNEKIYLKNVFIMLILALIIFSQPKSLILFMDGSTKEIQIKNMVLDSGETWTITEIISNGSESGSNYPSIALDSKGNAYVFWHEMTEDYLGSGSDPDIFLKFWNETSKTWVTSLVDTESWDYINGLDCDVDSKDNIHLAWSVNGDIWYKYWNVTSQTWSGISEISTEGDGATYPILAIDSADNIHIIWRDISNYDGSGSDQDIAYKFWNSTTQSWNTTTIISEGSTGSSGVEGYSMSIDPSGNVHIAWVDATEDYHGSESLRDIFYRFWNISEQSWSPITLISYGSTYFSINPTIEADSLGNVYLIWQESTYDYYSSGKSVGVYYKIFNASTYTWSLPMLISNEFYTSRSPICNIDSLDNIHLIFLSEENYDGSGTNTDVFYKKWDSTSKSWMSAMLVSTESIDQIYSHYYSKSIAVNELGDISIAWEDITNFDNCGVDKDVFYKKLGFLPSPVLNEITPDPSTTGDISLVWAPVLAANEYHIYRSDSTITSVNVLTPIATTSAYSFVDLSIPDGNYYYVVVASNDMINSTFSNVVSVSVELPEVNEFPIISSIFILGISSLSALIIYLRRKKGV